jgi:hypothetical protein
MKEIPFLSQTSWNNNHTVKFRFIVPSFENLVQLVNRGDMQSYTKGMLTYISQDSEYWYALKVKSKGFLSSFKRPKYLFVDNQTNKITLTNHPNLFVDEQIIENSSSFALSLRLLTQNYYSVQDIEVEKLSRQEMLNIFNNS